MIDAAPVRVHQRAFKGVRAEIPRIRHTVVVTVWEDVSGLYDGASLIDEHEKTKSVEETLDLVVRQFEPHGDDGR